MRYSETKKVGKKFVRNMMYKYFYVYQAAYVVGTTRSLLLLTPPTCGAPQCDNNCSLVYLGYLYAAISIQVWSQSKRR